MKESCPVGPPQQSWEGRTESLLLTPWHIYRLGLSVSAEGPHLPGPVLCLFSSTLNHARVQVGCSSGTTSPRFRLPNLSNYWDWKDTPPGKNLSARRVLLFAALKTLSSGRCRASLSNLHVDFELAEHSFILHWLCLQDSPQTTRKRRCDSFWTGGGEGVGLPATPRSIFLATSSAVRVIQP